MLVDFYRDERTVLMHGDSTTYTGDADFVFTNPYDYLPKQLRKKPMLICDFADRHAVAEERCGTKLRPISSWYGGQNMIWAGNTNNVPVDLTDLNPEDGFFPIELVKRLLDVYVINHETVWDGFMGRGTVGRVCRDAHMNFIGIDRDIKRVEMAVKYVIG